MSYKVETWNLIDYLDALDRQEGLVEQISRANAPGVLVFCSHPAVVTTGRGTKEGDISSWTGPIVAISRGGRATYHGPSQLVVYPIINLNQATSDRPARNLGIFLRHLEQAIVETLKKFGIEALGRSLQKKLGQDIPTEETGVWVGKHKVASIGIAVRKWITFHGAAINLDFDPSAFQGLKPCGFEASTMISVEEILGKKIERLVFQEELAKNLQKLI